MNKKRFSLIKNSRREFLKKAGIATSTAPTVLSNSCQIKNNPDAGPVEFKAVSEPNYTIYDTPETVHKDSLKQTACAFVDIVRDLDEVDREKISNPKFLKS